VTSDSPESAVLFDDDLSVVPRTSVSTIKRLRRAGPFPIPELPSFDKRHRYARKDVDAFLARENRLVLARRRSA
jgi:hypothetical protein